LRVTVIGVFAVAAERQQDLIDAIHRAGEVMRKKPGFLGSTVYASLDGAKVVNQSHWASSDALAAAREDPEGLALAEAMFEIATPDPIICVERGELRPE
jgi:quinol monooxygenase YgiN